MTIPIPEDGAAPRTGDGPGAGVDRFEVLASAGDLLASSLDYRETLQHVASAVVPGLGDLCMVDILEDGHLRRLATAHVDPAKAALMDELMRLRPTVEGTPAPAGRVLATGQPELLEDVTPDVVASHTSDAEHARLILAIGIRSNVSVPMVARGVVVGVLSVGITDSARRYTARDVALISELGRRAAMAVDNARLYAAAQSELEKRRVAETALRRSERHFRAIMEQSPMSTQRLSPDGRTIGANLAWQRLWGLDPTALGDYSVLEDPQLDAAGITPLLRRAFAGESVDLPAIAYYPERSLPELAIDSAPRWVTAFAYPVRDEDGTIEEVVLLHQDVTEARTLFEQLQVADRRKDEFLAMLAHELRNPLAPISTAAQLLRMVPESSPRVVDASQVISRQVAHMTELVDDLLDVSRVTRGLIQLEQEVVDMRSVVSAAIEQVQSLVQSKGHALQVDPGREPLVVEGDRARLVQVVANLLNNAAKYTPAGGAIALRMARVDGQVHIEVTDDGAGIEPALLPEVFELFTQGQRTPDRTQGGLGIGLALVQRLVQLHGGAVSAHSDGPGTGSRFVVQLPVSDRAPDAAAGPGDMPARAPQRRILVADDNADAADVLATVLRMQGHEVHVALDGAQALALVRRVPVLDLCLLDIGLPDMTGHALARAIRHHFGDACPMLVAVTGYGQPEDVAQSRAAGFDHHLVKPAELGQVLALVAALG